jgi:RNA polymerase sigma-70 factor (ECF subfamily)
MRSVAAGDHRAVEALYDRFGSLIFRRTFHSAPSRASAEDGVQEVFIRLWKTADQFEASNIALTAWVKRETDRVLNPRST